jgi:hypothetical protein
VFEHIHSFSRHIPLYFDFYCCLIYNSNFYLFYRNASEESACEEEATIQQEEPTEQPAAADSEAKDGEEKPQKSEAQLRAE